MISPNDDLDDMVNALQAKWEINAYLPAALDDEDRAIAAKLLGQVDTDRLSRLKRGERFKPTRPATTTKIEYFFVPGNGSVYSSFTGWSIDVFQGPRKRNVWRMLDGARCAFVICELEKRGHSPSLVITEAMRHAGITQRPLPSKVIVPPTSRRSVQLADQQGPPKRPPAKPRQGRSQRFAVLDALRGFTR